MRDFLKILIIISSSALLILFLNGIFQIALSAVSISTNPQDGATAVPLYLQISVEFDESIDPSTVTFELTPSVSGTVDYKECEILRYDYGSPDLYFTEPCYRLVFTPDTDLSPNTTYTATVSGGGLASYSWSFTTGNLSSNGEFEVKVDTTPSRHKPTVAMDREGNYVVVWQDPNGIYAQQYTSSGVPVGYRIDVEGTGMYYNDECGPAVAMNEKGEFIIAWQEKFEWERQDTILDILAQKYDKNGYPVGSQIHITHSLPSYIYGYPEVYSEVFIAFGGPSVGIDSNGRFIIVYQVPSCVEVCSEGEDCKVPRYQCDRYIFGRLYDSNGNLIKTVGSYSDTVAGGNSWSRSYDTPMVNNPPHPDDSSTWNYPCDYEGNITYDYAYYPTVSMAPDGRFVVTWLEWQCTEFDNVKARIFDSNGDPVTSEFQVNTFQGSRYDQWLPSAAINSNGDIIIVWNSRYQEGDDGGGIFGRRYDFYGNPLTSEFHINTTYTQDDQWGPNVAITPDGDFVITWQSNGQDCGGHGIYAKQYDSSGNPIGSEFRINTYNSLKLDMEEELNFDQSVTTWSEGPGIAINSAGNFVITWGSYDYEVYRDPSLGLPGWQGPGYASYGDGYGVYASIYCKDSDSDGISDCEDSDDDNDGMADSFETRYGLDPYNPTDASYDSDGDGLTNFQEYQQGTAPTIVDTDNDGVSDGIDNCPTIYNPDQSDINGDGIGDICDSDRDNDGLTEYEEALLGTDPSNPDTDGDGVDDFYDAFPLDPLETKDSDVQVVQITTDPSDQECPVIWHNQVVWLDYRNAQWDIYIV